MPLTDNPHPFEIEKRCSKVDTKRDYKIQVAIRQRVLPPVRKEKEKNLLLKSGSKTISPVAVIPRTGESVSQSSFSTIFIGVSEVCTYNAEAASLVNSPRNFKRNGCQKPCV